MSSNVALGSSQPVRTMDGSPAFVKGNWRCAVKDRLYRPNWQGNINGAAARMDASVLGANIHGIGNSFASRLRSRPRAIAVMPASTAQYLQQQVGGYPDSILSRTGLTQGPHHSYLDQLKLQHQDMVPISATAANGAPLIIMVPKSGAAALGADNIAAGHARPRPAHGKVMHNIGHNASTAGVGSGVASDSSSSSDSSFRFSDSTGSSSSSDNFSSSDTGKTNISYASDRISHFSFGGDFEAEYNKIKHENTLMTLINGKGAPIDMNDASREYNIGRERERQYNEQHHYNQQHHHSYGHASHNEPRHVTGIVEKVGRTMTALIEEPYEYRFADRHHSPSGRPPLVYDYGASGNDGQANMVESAIAAEIPHMVAAELAAQNQAAEGLSAGTQYLAAAENQYQLDRLEQQKHHHHHNHNQNHNNQQFQTVASALREERPREKKERKHSRRDHRHHRKDSNYGSDLSSDSCTDGSDSDYSYSTGSASDSTDDFDDSFNSEISSLDSGHSSTGTGRTSTDGACSFSSPSSLTSFSGCASSLSGSSSTNTTTDDPTTRRRRRDRRGRRDDNNDDRRERIVENERLAGWARDQDSINIDDAMRRARRLATDEATTLRRNGGYYDINHGRM